MRRFSKPSETWQRPSRLGARIPLISLIETLAVAVYLNFRHAAKHLGVSECIKRLEENLGVASSSVMRAGSA